jgi:4-amino-4-deoxy-L-arabinose transferase-like glycosyltransferase
MLTLLEKLSTKKTMLVLVLLCIPLFLGLLWYPAIWDGDESIYAEISHQMFIRHDWVAPYFNYTQLRFDKPPLVFWVNLIFYHLFGRNEFSTRLG